MWREYWSGSKAQVGKEGNIHAVILEDNQSVLLVKYWPIPFLHIAADQLLTEVSEPARQNHDGYIIRSNLADHWRIAGNST